MSSAALPSIQWLNVDYSDLVDKGAIIRTGQTLGSALGSGGLKGALQPLLDRYSALLGAAVELINSEDSPFTDVTAKYPAGAPQPAWAALFRSGKMAAFTDNRKTVRVFLQGSSPQTAYTENYGVIRHMLNTLKPAWGKLNVEIYAFENDYRTLALKLNPAPAILSGSYFGTPAGKVPLGLAGLAGFFAQGGQLEGARISGNDGLLLYARASSPPTLAGNKVQLSDLAVAYRAVFHAGNNKAFISLDPHKDVTRSAVNFGGFLEDTALGKVVLEADKRFKTITSGLDPNTFNDIRSETRKHVPYVLTVSERDMLSSSYKKDWVKTRFWFYPDSIEVQTDTTKHFAQIINPHFLADAERSRDDFSSSAEFEKKKKALLLPAIRRNIDELNSRFDDYANAFSEYRELVTVGRLMAICSWLYRVNPRWLDLDALLSVELPAMTTERERTQLIAATTLRAGNYENRIENIKENLSIYFLSPDLDRSISEYFSTGNDLAEFLAFRTERKEDSGSWQPEASRLLKANGQQAVRTLLLSQKDLQAFALFAGRKKQASGNPNVELAQIEAENKAIIGIQKELTAQGKQLQDCRAKIYGSTIAANIAGAQQCDEMAAAMNNQVALYQARADVFNKSVAAYNLGQNRSRTIMVEIGGGINLEAESFKIRTVKDSPQLNSFKKMTARAKPEWTDISKEEKWITNKVDSRREEVQKQTSFKSNTPRSAAVKPGAALIPKPLPGKTAGKSLFRSKAKAKTEIIVKTGDKFSPVIRGELVTPGHIVFKRVPRSSISR
ncbi:MAG: hypothetical protein Q7R35_15770 [Elusimicrobiota bacterium]|nr:hypothetical protein [Elusimicrobiota bacterium]